MKSNNCMTQDMGQIISHISTATRKLRRTMLIIFLMSIIGTTAVWGQPDYSGTYYIRSESTNKETSGADYYLCPTQDWCSYIITNGVEAIEAGDNQPFLTTERCKTANYAPGAANAVWVIEKAPNSNYYYIKHKSDSKYIVSNGKINTCNNPDRLRIHLETVSDLAALGDKVLFDITPYETYLVISPKGITDINSDAPSGHNNHVTHRWLSVNQGNKNGLKGTSARTDGPTSPAGYTNTGGLVGLYNQGDANAKFILEDVDAKPTISYSNSNSVTISYPTSAHIYYTTDGSDPTTSTTKEEFTETSKTITIDNTNCTVVKAVAEIGNDFSNIATYIFVQTGSTNPYLVQSVENTDFYMTAGDNNKVNTSSLPQAGMSWHLEDAGKVNGVQYYYVYNTSKPGYLRRDNNNFYISANKEDKTDYKFAIIPYYDENGIIAGFNLYNIGKTQFVFKADGNGVNNDVNLSTDGTQQRARWNLILVANKNFLEPVTLSDNTTTTYYTFTSSDQPDYLITPPTGTAVNVKTSTDESDSQKWYFENAGNDGWASYYYIKNAVTGEAMYFNGTASTGNQDNAIRIRELPDSPTDAYKFTLAKTITDGECYIIPKTLAQFAKTNYTGLWRENEKDIKTRQNRASNKIKWQINEIENYVAPPIITYDLNTGYVTITCTTSGADIYYTTNGSDPTDNSTSYSTSFPLGSASTIKAIAITSSGSSNITTKTVINGLYYIKHANNDWRMYPSTTTDGNGNPYVTTKTDKDEEAIWEIRQQGEYYTIKHYTDSKYMWTEDATIKFNTVHLATAENTTNDKLLYELTPDASLPGVYTIKPKNATNEDGKNFLDTSNGDNGTNTIGLWNTGNGIKWELVTIPTQPVITVDDIDVTITNTLGDIIYTTDGTDPLTSGTATTITTNSTSITLNYGKEYNIRAVSHYTDREATPNVHYSAESTETVDVEVEQPVISVSSTNQVTFSTPQAHNELITIRYNYDETANNPSDPTTTTGTVWDGSSSITLEDGKAYTIMAIAYTTEGSSTVKTIMVNLKPAISISTLADIDDQAGNYKFADNFTATGSPSDGIGTSAEKPFKGKIDGRMVEISLSSPLFAYVEDATIKNVIINTANITTSGHAGAIANVAQGETRIYNCGVLATGSTVEKDNDGYDYISSCTSTISGSGYVGSIVGLLDGSSRVINCFSYANVSGGTHGGGIVGYNNVATTAGNLKTMVMNCMYYGEVSGSSIAPIYNGEIITNDGDANGVNNFNYFRLESSYIQNTAITKVYNCALGAETRFLQRFEFYRYLLNSNRELAAWWATGDANNKNEMMKWVLEPNQIGSSIPYPILKTPSKYASVVNYTPGTTAYDYANRNTGGKLTSEGDGGVLHVTIQMGSAVSGKLSAPSGAGLKSGESGEIDLTITDKDFEHFNFNYGKVQLPYYNDYCDGNYTGNRVVTGWKIVSITVNGTATTTGTGSYTTGDDVTYTNGELTDTPYNFADRSSTKKDLYSQSGRVFNQGAYWDVPEGVTAITIEPYWGRAAYLSDASWDVVYNNGTGGGTGAGTANDAMTTAADVPHVGGGERYENGKKYNLATHSLDNNGQTVYTSMSNAIASGALFSESVTDPTVYDYAVVLVGNYHHTAAIEANKNYTVTSIDLDGDNEPDYSFMLRFNSRIAFHPVRYDFLNLIGLGMAQKTTGGTGSYNLGIMQPKAWFEVTNTALFRVTQFEYSKSRTKSPYILQGGVIEQWVTQQDNAGDGVSYFHIGGNVWFKEFHRGSHQDNADKSTPHPPVSVTGGDFAKFYLTGYYQSQAAIYDDNAECYINGGRFGEMAGAGMEGIGTSDGKGNITWVIDNADIKEFYGGGINYDKPVHGNIHTIISNSFVNQFCGGPKFGDMEDGRTVTTTATNCTFGTYFGAGYGGNAYNRYAPRNHNNIINFPHSESQAGNHASWNAWLAANYKQDYSTTYKGVSTQFDYQFLPMSSNTENVARIFVEYVGFSLATTHDVNSSLTGCTVTGNFYGGGSLGKVDGNVTSTLTNCTVNGSAFGAGYSASLPNVEVMNIEFVTEPYYYTDLGTYRTGVLPTTTTTTYTWEHSDEDEINSTDKAINKDNHILYTTENLNELGSVSGSVNLLLTTSGQDGKTTIVNNVYGGGDESSVSNTDTPANASTIVSISGNTEILGNVYGGGNEGDVSGSTTVNIQ